jgi:hypothetical protein
VAPNHQDCGVTITGSNARVAGFRLNKLEVKGASGVKLLGNVLLGRSLHLPLLLQ